MADEKKAEETKKDSGGLGALWIFLLITCIVLLGSNRGGQQSIDQRYNINSFKTQTYTAQDVDNLMLLVLCEASDQPHDCQGAIAAVVYNRAKLNCCSITDVITAPGQFAVYSDGAFWYNGCQVSLYDFPSEDISRVRSTVNSVLNGYDPTVCIGGALYYYRGYQEDGIPSKFHLGDYFFYRECS